MGKLINCPACGNQVSKSAATCPQCGEGIKRKANTASGGFMMFLIIGIPILMYWVFTSPLFK